MGIKREEEIRASMPINTFLSTRESVCAFFILHFVAGEGRAPRRVFDKGMIFATNPNGLYMRVSLGRLLALYVLRR